MYFAGFKSEMKQPNRNLPYKFLCILDWKSVFILEGGLILLY